MGIFNPFKKEPMKNWTGKIIELGEPLMECPKCRHQWHLSSVPNIGETLHLFCPKCGFRWTATLRGKKY